MQTRAGGCPERAQGLWRAVGQVTGGAEAGALRLGLVHGRRRPGANLVDDVSWDSAVGSDVGTTRRAGEEKPEARPCTQEREPCGSRAGQTRRRGLANNWTRGCWATCREMGLLVCYKMDLPLGQELGLKMGLKTSNGSWA